MKLQVKVMGLHSQSVVSKGVVKPIGVLQVRENGIHRFLETLLRLGFSGGSSILGWFVFESSKVCNGQRGFVFRRRRGVLRCEFNLAQELSLWAAPVMSAQSGTPSGEPAMRTWFQESIKRSFRQRATGIRLFPWRSTSRL